MKWIFYNLAWLVGLFAIAVFVLATHWTFGALLCGVAIGMRLLILGLVIKARRRVRSGEPSVIAVPEDVV